ncbi:hypothetical protein CROQUDRAFT_101981 [Cronartium quercuum f. sp. fusiforme G11]|uniref:Uncharacterized protein n=1 Tax=Cronartium quercuum f. sp. fusiforme G11 TaxID=708437 RepID=A0A9P6T573_9BASI|nr:hypothetical protein CROQUDRAFT_101981 [Cronartium quercuum f. sp. fusiforme G11]
MAYRFRGAVTPQELLERSRGAPGVEKLRPISGKGLWELPVSRSSDGSGDEVPSSFGKPEASPEIRVRNRLRSF